VTVQEIIAQAIKRGYLIAQSVEVVKDKTPLEWIHLIPVGHWDYHWMLDGPLDITTEHIVQMEANFRASQLDILVDWEHSSAFGMSSKAAGWVYEVDVRDDGLWGRVRWTPDALAEITKEEYRYLSPFFCMNWKSDKSGQMMGAKVFSTTLTNIPYFEEGLVQKIAASKETAMDFMKKMAAMLGLGEGATEDQLLAAAQAMKSTLDAIVSALKDIVAPADEAAAAKPPVEQVAAAKKILASAKQVQDKLDAVCKALGSPVTASAQELVDAISNSRKSEGELAATVAAMKTELDQARAERLVDAAQEAGKVVAATRGWALAFAARDPEGFKAHMLASPAMLPASKPRGPQPAGSDAEPTEAERIVAKAINMDPKEIAATRSKREAGGLD
jgi:phage I-like protein